MPFRRAVTGFGIEVWVVLALCYKLQAPAEDKRDSSSTTLTSAVSFFDCQLGHGKKLPDRELNLYGLDHQLDDVRGWG